MFTLFVLVSGCAHHKSPNAVATFSHALIKTNANVKESFIALKKTESLKHRAQLAALALCRESNCQPIESKVLERITVATKVTDRIFLILAGLEVYADLLLGFDGAEAQINPSASTKALGEHLRVSLDAVDALTPVDVTDFAEDIVIKAKDGVISLGDHMNQENIKGTISETVDAMQPNIEAIVAFLIDSIGSPTAVKRSDGTTRSKAHATRPRTGGRASRRP